MAIILSINSGSSSAKVAVYRSSGSHGPVPTQLADAQISGLTAPPVKLTYARGPEKVKNQEMSNSKIRTKMGAPHSGGVLLPYIGLSYIVEDKGLPEISSRDDIIYACHRVVHGGDYPAAHIIDPETYHHLEELADLAPLHSTSALAIVRSCIKTLPKAHGILGGRPRSAAAE